MGDNDYDPVGGHTKEEAEAAYAELFAELHGKRDAGGGVPYECGGGERERVAVVYSGEADKDSFAAATAYAGLKNATDPTREYIVRGTPGAASPTVFLDQCHPYGAACTFVYEMYIDKGHIPDAETAALLCKGIIAATDFFRAGTTVREDRIACAALANIAGLDIETLAADLSRS